jgi:protein O-GlcNAc transferase
VGSLKTGKSVTTGAAALGLLAWLLAFAAGESLAVRLSNAQSKQEVGTQARCSNSAASPELLSSPDLNFQDVEKQAEAEHYADGLRLNSEGDEAGAEREFKAALAEAPREGAYVWELGLLYIAEKRYNAAIEVVRDYTRLCGVTAVGYALEGELLFQQRQFDPASLAIAASLRLSDKSPRMHELLGLIYFATEKHAPAIYELERASGLDPNNPEIRYFYGRALYASGRYSQARDQFLSCLKIRSHYRKALENLGLCYEALGNYPEAAQAFLRAIALEEVQTGPKHGEPFAYYGAMLTKLDEARKALPILREGMAASPKSFVVNYELGRALLIIGHLDEAEHYLLIAGQLAPSYPRTYFLLGKVHEKQHRSTEAARDLAKFAELNKGAESVGFPLTDRLGAQD